MTVFCLLDIQIQTATLLYYTQVKYFYQYTTKCSTIILLVLFICQGEKIGFMIVVNDSQKIIETNYWDSEYAKNGYCYVSKNAGCYRLLIPAFRKDWMKDIKSANAVAIYRGSALDLMPPKHDSFQFRLYHMQHAAVSMQAKHGGVPD